MPVRTDIEIARDAKAAPVADIGRKIDIPVEALLHYGPTKAKLSFEFIDSLKHRSNGNLILVTAITPTPAGEGKTTTTVGLVDGLYQGTIAWSLLRHEGRRGRRRLCPSRADGGYQSPLHR